MRYTDFIKTLDHQPDRRRLDLIMAWLTKQQVPYRTQEYATGINLIVDLGLSPKRTGISSHFDKIAESGGANDNGSAIAVCLDIIKRFKEKGRYDQGLRIFFFDEEETGLKGSSAYIRQYGVADLTGLINLELVGMGNSFALWPLNKNSRGKLLQSFEQSAKNAGTTSTRFDKIITNTADHLSFRNAGLPDAFTVTCISAQDLMVAGNYYRALEGGAGTETLFGILSQAPVFTHYHQPTDTFDKIDENAILNTAAVVWDACQ